MMQSLQQWCTRSVVTVIAQLREAKRYDSQFQEALSLLPEPLFDKVLITCIKWNCISDHTLPLFFSPHLVELNLQHIAEPIAPDIWRNLNAACPRLEVLNLTRCTAFNDSSLYALFPPCTDTIHALPLLATLILRGVTISGHALGQAISIRCAQCCSALRCLDLSTIKLWFDIACERQGPKKLKHKAIGAIFSKCCNLERLYFANCDSLDSPSVGEMGKHCSRLQYLDLLGCKKIANYAFAPLSQNCALLRNLCVSHCSLIEEETVNRIITGTSHLVSLSANWCDRINDQTLAALTHLTCLMSLQLSGCASITDDGLTRLFEARTRIQNLHTLHLHSCALITDSSLTSLAASCPALLDLNLMDCIQVTDSGLKKVIKSCRQLQFLDVGVFVDVEFFERNAISPLPHILGSLRITDKTLTRLGKFSKNLQSLSLTGRRKINNQGIIALAEGCSSLTSLNMSGYGVDVKSLKVLSKKFIRLQNLTIRESCISIHKPVNRIPNAFSNGISRLANLQTLSLQECSLPARLFVESTTSSERLEGGKLAKTETDNVHTFVLPHVRHLDISSSAASSAFIADMLIAFPNLEELHITPNSVTDQIVEAIARNYPHLTVFYVDKTFIVDEGFKALALYCPELRVLSINYSSVTIATLQEIVKSCPKLQHLMVKGCMRLQIGRLNKLTVQNPNLKIYNTQRY